MSLLEHLPAGPGEHAARDYACFGKQNHTFLLACIVPPRVLAKQAPPFAPSRTGDNRLPHVIIALHSNLSALNRPSNSTCCSSSRHVTKIKNCSGIAPSCSG